MVAIAHRFADQYVLEPEKSRNLFLVFGTDAGLVSERSRLLLQSYAKLSASPQRTLHFSGDALASDPRVLLDEIHSLGLFDRSAPAIRISLGSRNLVPTLELIAKSAPFEAHVIIEGGPLKRTAPIRSWFEKHNFAVAIECYADQPKDLRRLVEAEFSAAGASIDHDVIELLLNVLGEDRLLSRREIEKLLLYAHGQNNISREHAIEILASHASTKSDELFIDAFKGDPTATISHLYSASARASEVNAIANNMLRIAMAFSHARAQLNGGAGIEATLQNFLRTLNAYSHTQAIAAELNSRSAADTASIVKLFYELIKDTRKSSILTEERISREFIKLAKASEKKPRQF
ncbi:hypothetical protein K9U39_16560 [Rhodoblastus acidophilus]|uniref:DNA polymerase III subunit delta n=1 Tax=Candidatus Rhodoblastus alkanivorans TaxID=2954117 RepID=A0ABS9Z2E3_9HYPH|nr:hypothetical protein [Candidatus Rhodoblastus alkanivorans]MCI4679940.1 hypothetical protein [Candidatus Rhodoblastus alkanivorans]MCI4681485.1 hypothetical protein [Candidatus Rhodoblastus alkanivorans]MDI4642533.1 hypothetical protein [Rhodoblastus acidophilus]